MIRAEYDVKVENLYVCMWVFACCVVFLATNLFFFLGGGVGGLTFLIKTVGGTGMG